MTIHEFGKENDKIMVLLHPAVVMWDIDYIRKVYPNTLFKKFENAGHASLAPFQPERFINDIVQ